MASSRLEKVGTIYSRIKGLLRAGALKEIDKPLWYDLYTAFPPKYEPRYDRPAPDIPIRKIFYSEDIIRAKFHKDNKARLSINLADNQSETLTQKFISIYNKLKEEGKTPEEDIYTTALELLKMQKNITKEAQSYIKVTDATKSSFVSSFEEAQREKEKANINIKDIFKE